MSKTPICGHGGVVSVGNIPLTQITDFGRLNTDEYNVPTHSYRLTTDDSQMQDLPTMFLVGKLREPATPPRHGTIYVSWTSERPLVRVYVTLKEWRKLKRHARRERLRREHQKRKQ